MIRRLLPIALMLALPVLAGQVYKWTDAKGTVHYSDSPPPQGVRYSRVRVAGAGVDVPEQPAPGQTPAGSAPAAASSAHVADTPDNRAKLCADLRKNIALLESDQPLAMDAAGNKPQNLDATRRSQELATERDQYRRYCGGR